MLDILASWTFKQRAAAFFVLGVLILTVFHARIYNGIAGPFDVEARDLAAMHDLPAKQFVRVVRNGQPVQYSELRKATFYEEEVSGNVGTVTASFGFLDDGDRPFAVRIADATNPEVIGVIDTPSDRVAQWTGRVFILDCDKSSYRMYALLAALAGVVSLFVALDQLRRAYSKPKAQRPMRLFT